MTIAKYTPQQEREKEIEKLRARIKCLEEMDLKGWIARMGRCHRIKLLKRQILELQTTK